VRLVQVEERTRLSLQEAPIEELKVQSDSRATNMQRE